MAGWKLKFEIFYFYSILSTPTDTFKLRPSKDVIQRSFDDWCLAKVSGEPKQKNRSYKCSKLETLPSWPLFSLANKTKTINDTNKKLWKSVNKMQKTTQEKFQVINHFSFYKNTAQSWKLPLNHNLGYFWCFWSPEDDVTEKQMTTNFSDTVCSR